jgi:glycosyltransferase involved in cell wall biosynthesis
MAKVSVIVITYNRSKLVGAAITSVLNQTFQDFELIVVDDASTDDTAEVLQTFNDQRIRYIRHETNRREAAARNTGIQNSKSEYIAFLDDDDEWLPEKLQKQVNLLDSRPTIVGVVYTGSFQIDRATGKRLLHIVPRRRGNVFQDILIQNWVTLSTVLVRRACFDEVGLFDESIPFGLDYDMWIRISREFQFEYIADPLVNYYVHNNKLSTDHDIVIRGSETIIRKYKQLFVLNRKHYSNRYYGIGVCYCLAGKISEGRKALFQAIRLYPFDLRYYFRLLLSILGAENFKKASEFRDRLSVWVRK